MKIATGGDPYVTEALALIRKEYGLPHSSKAHLPDRDDGKFQLVEGGDLDESDESDVPGDSYGLDGDEEDRTALEVFTFVKGAWEATGDDDEFAIEDPYQDEDEDEPEFTTFSFVKQRGGVDEEGEELFSLVSKTGGVEGDGCSDIVLVRVDDVRIE